MKIWITLGKFPLSFCHKQDLKPLAKIHGRLTDLFASYSPKLLTGVVSGGHGYPTHELTVRSDDPLFERLIEQFRDEIKQSNPRIVGFFRATPEPEETKRARFIEPLFFGDSVDEDANGRPLNPTPRVLCESCKFPDLTVAPNPLLVSKAAMKKQDIFRVSTGMVVVRPRVLKILQEAIGSQIETGEAIIAKSKEKLTGEDRLFWIRPKEAIGNRLNKRVGKQCPVCKQILDSWQVSVTDAASDVGLLDAREWIEHFGSGKSDFVRLGGHYGEFKPDKPRWYWPMLMSGALVAYLKANGVKGMAASTSQTEAKVIWSKKGDAIVEPQLRTFGSVSTAAASTVKNQKGIARGRQTVAALSSTPWDYDQKGFVYFHLTTPEFMVIDPMTWEEDNEGPYRVSNFKKPGLYRLPVTAIKEAEEDKRGVAVDSASLLFIDNAFFAALQEHYDWDKAVKSSGRIDAKYHDKIALKIGSRFGVCSTPPKKFKSEFAGDGFYKILPARITPA